MKLKALYWDESRERYRGWIGGAVWWYWPVILLWEWPRNSFQLWLFDRRNR